MRAMASSSTRVMTAISLSDRARFDSWLSERTAVFVVVAGIVIFRTLVYLLFEQAAFDSDQAIVGLMAKHLMEGRAFPLFFYGQTYMLGVEAWAAVPFFLVAGPTVPALRLSMLAWNIAFGLLIVAGLQRDAGLRPWSALLPALFFLAAPASVSTQLVTAQGGIIEPFVYIGVLWFLRRRPLWFGAVLAIGFRNREFTLYAAPVLVLLELFTGELNRARAREWLMSIVTFFAVWESIEALKPFADLSGPGTRGQLLGGFSGSSQISTLMDRFNWQTGALGERVGRMSTELVAWFAGASQVDTTLPIPDRPWLVWAASLCLLLAAGRLAQLLVRSEAVTASDRSFLRRLRAKVARAQFAFYIFGVGAVAISAFVAGKPVLHGYPRYVVLGVLAPLGLTAALLRLESRRFLRQLVAVVVIAWGALMIADHATVLVAHVRHPPQNSVREMADHLVAQRVPVAAAGYWQAYAISFVARERVRVASTDFVRIQEYQDLFIDRLSDAVLISETACPGGERVAGSYLCKP